MPHLFSYGTLQQEDVQLATFGRALHGERDALVGFELAEVPIPDRDVAARLGRTHHANVVVTGRAGSRVNGTVFEITDAELAAADHYEASADYVRVLAKLVSGRDAWVYVAAPGRGDG